MTSSVHVRAGVHGFRNARNVVGNPNEHAFHCGALGGFYIAGQRDLPLVAGFNFEIWTGPDLTPIADAIAGLGDALVAVFMWDAATQSYQTFRTAGPAFTNNLEALVFGRAVWLLLSDDAVWAQPARDPVEG